MQKNGNKRQARVPTGVQWLDNVTKGGFLSGKTYITAGAPGAGKTMLAMQFTLAALRNAKNAIYVCVNEQPDDLIAAAQSMNWDLAKPIRKNNLRVLDLSPFFSNFAMKSLNKIDHRAHEVNIRKILVELGKHARETDAECLVIDSINSVLSLSSEANAIEFARELIFSIEGHLGCTTLLTYDRWNGDSGRDIHPIESYASGIIELGLGESDESEIERILQIKKFRATAVEPLKYRFAIVPTEGIIQCSFVEPRGALEIDLPRK